MPLHGLLSGFAAPSKARRRGINVSIRLLIMVSHVCNLSSRRLKQEDREFEGNLEPGLHVETLSQKKKKKKWNQSPTAGEW
jgi:hypothetical protein